MRTRQRRTKQRRRWRQGARAVRRSWVAAAAVSTAAVLALPAAAQAATFTVTSLDDDPQLSPNLRFAITLANANPGPDTIVFASGLTGTITLSSQLPTVSEAVAIQGPGAGQITVSGNDSSRILEFDGAGPSSVSGLTLTAGNAGGDLRGGAIRSEGTGLTIQDSAITDSIAGDLGGGLFSSLGTTTITDSTFSGNEAATAGGGVFSSGGSITITGSTIAGNLAGFAGGGAVGVAGTTTITDSTISGNDALGHSGGVFTDGGTIESSTISGNSAEDRGGVRAEGATTLANTVVAGNAASGFSPDLDGTFHARFSLIGSTAGATVNETVPGSNIVDASPLLGPLAFNGGQTRTHRPLPGSPAIDKGSETGTDQRGLARPIDVPFVANSLAGGNAADIGAVELTVAEATPAPAAAPPAAVPPVTKRKKCRKGFRLKKVRTKSGKKRTKCVRKKGRKRN